MNVSSPIDRGPQLAAVASLRSNTLLGITAGCWIVVSLFWASIGIADEPANRPTEVEKALTEVAETSPSDVEDKSEEQEKSEKQDTARDAKVNEGEGRVEAENEVAGDLESEVDSPLAAAWRGRTPRWIGLYGSQIADLVPEDFRPISIDELNRVISDDHSAVNDVSDLPITRCLILAKVEESSTTSSRSDQNASEVGDSILRSLSTTLYLPQEASISSPLRYPLGPLNLSIRHAHSASVEPSAEQSVGAESSILCGARGDAFAVGLPGTEVSMDWSLRSEPTHAGRQWSIRLPDATVTEFYLSVDANDLIEVQNGSAERVDFETIRSLNQIDGDESEGREWYRIEAPPQSFIQLSLTPRATEPNEVTVVRGCRLTTRCVGDQLKWSARVTLDRQAGIPSIRWTGGELTSVQCDGREIPLDQDAVVSKPNSEAARSTSTVLVYEGVSPIAGGGSRLKLPRPVFDAEHFFMPPQAWQLQLEIEASRLVSDFQLPDGWKIHQSNIATTTAPSSDTATNNSVKDPDAASGSALEQVTRWIGSGPAPTEQDPWSISIERQNALVFANHQVRFEMDETSIQARGKLIVEMPAGSVQPITLEVQDGFQFDFIGIGAARRNVTAQMSQGPTRRLTIWPGAEEIETDQNQRGRLVLYVNARARRGAISESRNDAISRTNQSPADKPAKKNGQPDSTQESPTSQNPSKLDSWQSTLGPLWLMRVNDCPGQLLATIIPPTNLSWTAKAAIDPARIEFADLNSEQRRFFAPLPGDAIVFGGAIESTPAVELENPDVDLSVSIRTTVGLKTPLIADRSDRRLESLTQTTEVKTEGTSGVISKMRIRYPGGHKDADESLRFDWSIRMRPGEPEIPVAQSDVSKEWIESTGIWEVRIALPAKYSNQSTLIGRRQRALVGDAGSSDGVWLGLPNVPDAASQVAELLIEPSLQLRRQTDSLLGVPTLPNAINGEATPSATNPSWSRFRYEADGQPWIEVARRRFTPPTVLIVQQRLRCIASVSGTDTLRLSCLARTDSDLRLSFPAGLQLTRLRIDGKNASLQTRPGRGVTIAHAKDRRWVSLEADWISPTSNDRWYRWYHFPVIELNELVVDAQREVVMASGTLALRTFTNPWQWNSSMAVLLVPSGLVGGIGWLSALLLLGLARMTGTRGIPIMTSGIALSVLAGILWPSTILPMAAFVAFPLTLAALQGSTSYWLRREQEHEGSGVVPSGSWSQPPHPDDARWADDGKFPSGEGQTPAASSRSKGGVKTRLHQADPNERSHADFSSSAIFPCLVAVSLSLSTSWFDPPSVQAQDTTAPAKPTDGNEIVTEPSFESGDVINPAVDVLVPLKKDGTILGDKIYIPELFYNELFFKDVGARIENALISQAKYRLRLRSTSSLENDPSVTSDGIAPTPVERTADEPSAAERAAEVVEILRAKDCVRLQVDLVLRKSGGAKRLRLPYQAEQVQDVVVLDSSTTNREMTSGLPPRFGSDDGGWLWVEPSDDRDLAVRLILRCQLDWESPWALVNVNIPPLAISELTLQTERNVHSVMIQTPRSSRFIPCDEPSIDDPFASDSDSIAIGTISQLDLRFRFDESSAAELPWNDPDQWRTRYWVYAHRDRTVVECELEPRLKLPPRAVVSLQSTFPGVEVLCQDWRIEQSSKSGDGSDDSKASESLRMISLADQQQPIRLGWTIPTPSELRDVSNGPSWDVNLPQARIGSVPIDPTDDIASVGTKNLPWTAWTFSSNVQPDWTEPLALEPLAVDQFYSQWTGFLRSIDRATIGFIDRLKLRTIEKPRTQWLTRHAIDIGATEQRIEYLAEIKPPVTTNENRSTGSSQYSLRLPPEARILDWRYAVADGPTISPSRGLSTQGLENEIQSDGEKVGDSATSVDAPVTTVPWKIVRRRTPNGDQTTLYFDGPPSGFVVEVDAVLSHQAAREKSPAAKSPTAKSPRAKSATAKSATAKSATAGDALKLGWMQLEHLSGSHATADETEFEQVHDLQITRSLDTRFRWIKPLEAERITEAFEDAAELLTAGKVLVDRYTSTGPLEQWVSKPRFRVGKLNPKFDVDSRITLRWEEGRWTAQTDCEIKSKYCPDFIDVAIPTRWCDSLQIDPVCVSSRQPTLDPALQVIRIELQRVAPGDPAPASDSPTDSKTPAVKSMLEPVRKFRLVSRLAVSETARVSVPEIRILDARRHRIDVVVPTRLTNEQVRWRSNFAGPLEKPRWTVESPMRLPDDSASSVYAVTSPGWSIDLETLPQTNRAAECLHADHRVLVRPHHSHALLISRFDIWPGDQAFVRLSHSDASDLLGVWAATRPADLREFAVEQGSDAKPGIDLHDNESSIDLGQAKRRHWDVPLPLSRLSQTIEVLTSFQLSDFPPSLSPSESYSLLLPSLVGVSDPPEAATVSWCEMPGAGNRLRSNAADWIESPISPEQRAQILASSLVRAITASSDALADRRDEEVAVWMRPWLQRYQILSRSVGRTLGQDESPDDAGDLPDSAEKVADKSGARKPRDSMLDEVDANESFVLPWAEMDRFVVNQETRYFAGDSESFVGEPVAPMLNGSTDSVMMEVADGNWSDFLSLSTPPGYVPRWTFQWKHRTLPVARLALHSGWLPESTRQHLMRAGVFVAAAAFVLVPVVLPRSRGKVRTEGDLDELDSDPKSVTSQWSSGSGLRHPAAWLFALGLIGLLLMPIPLSLGLMFVAIVMGGIDPGYLALRRWWRA